MSKLKTAKAIRKSFAVAGVILKWAAIVFCIVGVGTGLWAWASWHFISFAIVISIIVAVFVVGAIAEAWEWSGKTIAQAEAEEREAQQQARAEKLRAERPVHNPSRRTVPFFDEDTDNEGWH